MSISGLNSIIQQNLHKIWVKTPDEKAEDKFQENMNGPLDAANSAGSTETITGTTISGGYTANTLWQAQAIAQSPDSNAIDVEPAEAIVKKASPAEEFLKYMDKTPEELIREEILKELGYTEEELVAMDPKDRAKIETQIKERIEIKIEEAMREEGLDIQTGKTAILNAISFKFAA